MQRLFSKNATGIAPDGRWYAGDPNAMQDAAAAQADFSQFIDLAGIRIGDSTIQLLKYGTAEARISAALRIDGILRALGGFYAGAFTTAQRDALAVAARPYGLIILNISTNQIEWNSGTDVTPNWKPAGVDPSGSLTFYPQTAGNYIVTSRRAADNQPRFKLREDGRMEFGDGANVPDAFLERTGPGSLSLAGQPVVVANDPALYDQVKILARPDPFLIANTTTETEFLNYTVPGGYMGSRGELHYYMKGRFGHASLAGGLHATIRLYLAGTLIGSITENGSGSNGTTALGGFDIFVRNYGSTVAQRVYMENGMPGWGGINSSSGLVATKDTSQNMQMRVTAQLISGPEYSIDIYTHYLEFRK